jgi:hypothetical protein
VGPAGALIAQPGVAGKVGVVVATPGDPGGRAFPGNFINAFNNFYGAQNTVINYNFETQLIYDDG